MKILFVVEKSTKYGSAFSAKQLINGLLNHGVEVAIVVPSNIDDVSFYSETGCPIIKIPFTYCSISRSSSKLMNAIKIPIRTIEHKLLMLIGVPKLSSIVKKNNYDIIHCNSSRIDIAAVVSKKNGIPLVWHVREFGDDDFNRIELGTNTVKLMNEMIGVSVGVSYIVCNHWIKRGVYPEKIRKVYNGVPSIEPEECSPSLDGHMRCIFVGTVAKTKGQYQVIEALGRMRINNCEVDFVGGGDEKYIESLQTRSKELGIEKRVRFLGYQQNISRMLYQYDCGFSCSKSEGFGRNTAEYMMAGLPVIASNTGANPELVVDEVTGLLYEYENIEDLGKKIIRLSYDYTMRACMGKAGKERAQDLFHVSKYIDGVIDVYKDITNRKY